MPRNMPVMSGKYALPAKLRLRQRLQFDRVFARRCSAADERLIIYVEQNGLSFSRMGLSVSKRTGGSVLRHRLRRLIREAFRLSQHEIDSGLDIVCIPRGQPATLDEYRMSLAKLVKTASRRIKEQN